MTRRVLLLVVVVYPFAACAGRSAAATANSSKTSLASVTLAITGMTWQGCVDPVRSALLAVRGVTQADVVFEGHEARVQYDTTQCTVTDLIRAVASAKDAAMPTHFGATVKR